MIRHFGDLEFVVLWEKAGHDFLPVPFLATSRTPGYRDYLREKDETWERLRGVTDQSVETMLRVLAHPDIAIEVQGRCGRDPLDPKASIRLLAVRAGMDGYLIEQLPGETVCHSAGFTVRGCPVTELAQAVVGALPAVDPGARAEVVLVDREDAEEVDYGYGESLVHDSAEGSAAARGREFLCHPTSRIGMIDVVQARSKYGPRGRTRHRLEWRDLDGDGRYVIEDRRPPLAIPAGAARLTTLINVRIAEIVRDIRDERC